MKTHNKVALITGGTDGIGRQVALGLAQMGVNLILVGRSTEKAQTTLSTLHATNPNIDVTFLQHDLSLMREVKQLAETIQKQVDHLDIVVHCAGVMLSERTLTDEGLETVFAVQYLARYLLTHDLLALCDDARIINVSAGGNVNMALDFENLNGEKSYDGVMALRQESVANDMLTLDLNAKYPDIKIYCYGPGYVKTTLLRDMPKWFQAVSQLAGVFIGYMPAQAADDILTLINGDYPLGLYDRKIKQNHARGFRIDEVNRARLRTLSDEMIQNALNQRSQRETNSRKSGIIDSPICSG